MKAGLVLPLSLVLAAYLMPVAASGQQSSNPDAERQPTSAPAAPQTTQPANPTPEGTLPESHPRILRVIPAFDVTNLRRAPSLSSKEKFKLFARQSFDPFQWIAAGAQAGWSQEQNHMPAYGQGATGYGKRYGAAMADVTDREFLSSFLFPVLLKQDPRYFRLGHGSIPHRTIYSLSQEFSAKTDQGTRQFNYSKVVGALVSKAIANTYYPPSDRGARLTLNRTGASLLSGMATGLGAEFWPDIDCKVFHKCSAK